MGIVAGIAKQDRCISGNDPLPRQIGRKADCRGNMFRLKRWILSEDSIRSLALGKIVQYDRDRNAGSLKAYGTMHDFGIGGDVGLPVHRRRLQCRH